MKNLALTSLFLLLLSGCSPALFNNFQRIPDVSVQTNEVMNWFRGGNGRFIFQTGIDIYRNHFSGLMVIKPAADNSYRVLFITETGIRVFDMEFSGNGDFKLHYCMEALNRKPLIKTLKNDIFLMLGSPPAEAKRKMMQEKHDGRNIIRSKEGSGVKYYFIEPRTNKTEEIIQTGRMTKKVNMKLYSKGGTELDSVVISHYHLKLNLFLTRLHENNTGVSE